MMSPENNETVWYTWSAEIKSGRVERVSRAAKVSTFWSISCHSTGDISEDSYGMASHDRPPPSVCTGAVHSALRTVGEFDG